VKEGDPTKLAVILAGGGACWTGENCALHGKPFYRPFAGLEQDPTEFGGVFDTANPENPLADSTIVYLPTANGDVFLGDSVTTYDVPAMGGQPAGKINILHKGYENAASALDWMFKTYRHPKTVVVMGWSAGALASPLYTHIVAQHYPDASVSHFADGGGATFFVKGKRLTAFGKPVGGRENIGRLLLNVIPQFRETVPGFRQETTFANGLPSIISYSGHTPLSLLMLEQDGAGIRNIYVQTNPEKLKRFIRQD